MVQLVNTQPCHGCNPGSSPGAGVRNTYKHKKFLINYEKEFRLLANDPVSCCFYEQYNFNVEQQIICNK